MVRSLEYKNTTIEEMQDLDITSDDMKIGGVLDRETSISTFTLMLLSNNRFARTLYHCGQPLCVVMYVDGVGSIYKLRQSNPVTLVKNIDSVVMTVMKLLLKYKVKHIEIEYSNKNKFTQKAMSYMDVLAVKNGFRTYYKQNKNTIEYKLERV